MTQGVCPATIHASHVISATNSAEILLTFGHTRMVVNDGQNGEAPSTAVIEWLHTLSMSPTAAYSLHTILGDTLMKYAEKFGPITCDRDLEKRLMQATQGEHAA